MVEVEVTRLVELLDDRGKQELEVYSKEDTINPDEIMILYINNTHDFKDNTLYCENTIYVDSVKLLSYYVNHGYKVIGVEYGLLRPDVLSYLTSTKVKYKPITDVYTLKVPTLIPMWNKTHF